MGIRSLAKQIQSSYNKSLHLSQAARAGASTLFSIYVFQESL